MTLSRLCLLLLVRPPSVCGSAPLCGNVGLWDAELLFAQLFRYLSLKTKIQRCTAENLRFVHEISKNDFN